MFRLIHLVQQQLLYLLVRFMTVIAVGLVNSNWILAMDKGHYVFLNWILAMDMGHSVVSFRIIGGTV